MLNLLRRSHVLSMVLIPARLHSVQKLSPINILFVVFTCHRLWCGETLWRTSKAVLWGTY